MKLRLLLLVSLFAISTSICFADANTTPSDTTCDAPTPVKTPPPAYQKSNVKDQPDKTADLPSVVQTVEKALECYQALSHEPDPLQPKGLPKLSSANLDFKTTTAKSAGFSVTVFIFKIGGSAEKDVTNDISFTYAPKTPPPTKTHGIAKKQPSPLYEELIRAIESAAAAAQAQSTLLGLPINKVSVVVSYGIKFDGNISLNLPIQLVTLTGNGDYNKNNTQSITLTFGPQQP